jgi:Tfp pilus assembly protein PilO
MSDLAVLEGLAEELPIVAKIIGHFEQLTATIETLTDAVGLLSRCDDLRKLEIDTLARQVAELSKPTA